MAGCSDPNTPNEATIALGERLFHDPSLSADGKVSCSSCHQAEAAFADSRPVSVGVRGVSGTRNAPSLLDLPDMNTFFWDGRENDLKEVVLQAFTNPAEMGLASRQALLESVARSPNLKQAQAPSLQQISSALIAYLHSLPQGKSRYDHHLSGTQEQALNPKEQAGLALFTGKAECSQCHLLPGTSGYFTDNRFHHAGVGFERVSGQIQPLVDRLDTLEAEQRPIGEAILSDSQIAELGRFASTRSPVELGAFRTPSLRNVAITAPYMHDGSVATLADAVDREIYYRSLARGRQINLTVEERTALLAFLQTLTTDSAEASQRRSGATSPPQQVER